MQKSRANCSQTLRANVSIWFCFLYLRFAVFDGARLLARRARQRPTEPSTAAGPVLRPTAPAVHRWQCAPLRRLAASACGRAPGTGVAASASAAESWPAARSSRAPIAVLPPECPTWTRRDASIRPRFWPATLTNDSFRTAFRFAAATRLSAAGEMETKRPILVSESQLCLNRRTLVNPKAASTTG